MERQSYQLVCLDMALSTTTSIINKKNVPLSVLLCLRQNLLLSRGSSSLLFSLLSLLYLKKKQRVYNTPKN